MRIKGDTHSQWKGDQASYKAIHQWVQRHFGKERCCADCGTKTAKLYEWANISGTYKRIRILF